jgi:glycosyltransferase involved in cell wall biosynthesis
MAVHSHFSSTGGAEIQARTLSTGLVERGWKVGVVALSGNSKTVEEISDCGIQISTISVPKVPKLAGLILMFQFARHLYRERNRYQVIHVHIMKTMAFVASVVGKFLGKKVILKVSGIDELEQTTLSEKNSNSPFYKLLNWGCRKADVIIAISHRTANRLRACGYSESQIIYLPNGVDVNRFAPAGNPGRNRNAIGADASHVAIFVGRFAPEKGLYDLLQAWAIVRQAFPNSLLCLVGDGRLRRGLEAVVRADRFLQGAVHFAGESKRVQDFLASADCYVCSSFEEGLSNTMLEAMAAGLPIVSTAVSGAEDVIEVGKNGYVVPVGNPEELAAAIKKVFSDLTQAKQMGQFSRAKALEVFDVARVLDRYEDLYCSK